MSSAEAAADLPTSTDVLDTNIVADGVELAEGSLGVVQVVAKKAAEMAATMNLTPEVQALAVLANMDLLFHNEFVSTYKILVPIFFKL